MEPTIKRGESKKALYIFLCSLLGMLIFVMLQKSTLLLLTTLLTNQGEFNFIGVSSLLYKFETISYLLALFFGGWYGVWLGLHWHEIVYESGRGGLLYAFWGNMMHHEPDTQSTAKQPVRASQAASNATLSNNREWQFDDLAKLKSPSRPPSSGSEEWTKKVSVKPAVAVTTKTKTTPRKPIKRTVTLATEPISVALSPKKTTSRKRAPKKTTSAK